MKDKPLTLRQVSKILSIPEKEIISLASSGIIAHMKIDGGYIRFKKEDILRNKDELMKRYNVIQNREDIKDKIRNFFYFNDFYLVSCAVIIFLLWFIFK